MPGVTVFLDMVPDGVLNAGEPSAVTDGSGHYSFGGLIAGTYLVRVAVATLPSGAVQTGDPDGTLNNSTSVTLAAGQTILTADFGYRLPKAESWSAWQYQNPLGGQNGPSQNPDGDIYPNLLEYAFCLPPGSGRPLTPNGDPSFCVIQNGTGGFDAFLRQKCAPLAGDHSCLTKPSCFARSITGRRFSSCPFCCQIIYRFFCFGEFKISCELFVRNMRRARSDA